MTPIGATINHLCRSQIARTTGFVVLSLLACEAIAQQQHTPASQSQSRWALQKPFRSNGPGVGGGAVLGQLTIAPGAERDIASRSLVQALQQLGLSVARPQVGLTGTIPPNREWRSDIAPLQPALIDGYNRNHPESPLPVARYGIRFIGMHDVANSRFRYRMNALLFERGTLGPWRPVRDSRYVGNYFITHLASLIDGALTRNASPAA